MTTLKPGRELDALVAEKVMGGELRPYSTDISAAWEVVEKYKWAEPELRYSDEQHCWVFSLHKASGYPNECGDTAPHAICLAALRAVGYEP